MVTVSTLALVPIHGSNSVIAGVRMREADPEYQECALFGTKLIRHESAFTTHLHNLVAVGDRGVGNGGGCGAQGPRARSYVAMFMRQANQVCPS